MQSHATQGRMNALDFAFSGTLLTALSSGALWWPDEGVLCVSDLHLGKSERMARRSGTMLPPYEVEETLNRLSEDIAATAPNTVICLGDSFDDLEAAEAVQAELNLRLAPMMAGRRWIWIEGNHDPGPVDLAGTHLAELALGPLFFCHMARADGPQGEVSGHYHPKARLGAGGRVISRRCFLLDEKRVILPAYGTYTGGLFADDPALTSLMQEQPRAILLNSPPLMIPV